MRPFASHSVSQSDIVDLATPYRSFNVVKRNRAKSIFEGASGDTRHDAQAKALAAELEKPCGHLWQAPQALRIRRGEPMRSATMSDDDITIAEVDR
jgi:hypothetical protein